MSLFHRIIKKDMEDIYIMIGTDLHRLEGKSILITGAGGLLASYLVYTVVFLNREVFKTPCLLYVMTRRPAKDYERLWWLDNEPYTKNIIHDVASHYHLEVPMDFVMHAASLASPVDYMGDIIGTINANARGLQHLLDHACQNEDTLLLFFSSGEIYGSPPPDQVPTHETYLGSVDPVGTRSCYTESKRFGETLCAAYHAVHNTQAKIVRPFQVFGPGISDKDKRAFPEFLHCAVKKQPIVLRSEGKAQRTFCYISDAAVAFWKVLFEGRPAFPYNVGTSAPLVTIHELAKKIAELGNVNIETKISAENSYLDDSPQVTCPDIGRISQLVGSKPKKTLDEGIHLTLEWLRDQRRVR